MPFLYHVLEFAAEEGCVIVRRIVRPPCQYGRPLPFRTYLCRGPQGRRGACTGRGGGAPDGSPLTGAQSYHDPAVPPQTPPIPSPPPSPRTN